MSEKIYHTITVKARPETVFKAISTKAGIQGWWTPDNVIKPVIGSTAEFIFGKKYHNKMIIADLQENKRVAWKCVEGDPEWKNTVFAFEISEKNGVTELHFTQANWREKTDFFDYCNRQWGKYMSSLKDYCETGKGNPFIPDH